jgi:hypothetical protein
MKTRCFSHWNEYQGVHVEFSVRRPSPPNTYSYVRKEKLDSTRKFVRNYLNWRTKNLNTSTTIRKILGPKKMLTNICKYVKPKPISRQNQKLTQYNSTTGKKVPLAPAQRVYSFLCNSVPLQFCLSVRANRGMWSKRVLIRKIGNFSFSVRRRNTTIIHDFYLHRKFSIFLRNDSDC